MDLVSVDEDSYGPKHGVSTLGFKEHSNLAATRLPIKVRNQGKGHTEGKGDPKLPGDGCGEGVLVEGSFQALVGTSNSEFRC